MAIIDEASGFEDREGGVGRGDEDLLFSEEDRLSGSTLTRIISRCLVP